MSEEVEVKVEDSPAEKEARMFGWRPQEEWTGPAERWRTAEEFLEEGKRLNGFLRKDMATLRAEIGRRDQAIAEMRQAISDFAKFHQETEERAYARAKSDLKAARRSALAEGDTSRALELEDQMEELESARKVSPKPPTPPTAQTPPEIDQTFQAWVDQNAWYKNSRKLRGVANSYADDVKVELPHLSGVQFLEEVKRRVQEDFPDDFAPPARRQAPSVESGGEERRSSRAKGYADLPPDAKQACDQFVRSGLLTREQYIKDYFGD